MHGEAHRVAAELSEPVLQQVAGGARHLDPVSHGSYPAISSRRVAWAVMPVGRVCGTAIGMALKPTLSRTLSRSISSMIARTKRSHRRSGSGPLSSRKGALECPGPGAG